MNYNSLENEFSDYHKLVKLMEDYEKLDTMVTPTDIQTGILGVNHLSELLKKAIALTEKTNNVEIKEIIVELRNQLADTKNLLVDTKEELINLKSDNQKLQQEVEKLKSSEWQLIFDNKKQAFFESNDTELKIPYCADCWNNKKEKYILSNLNKIGGFVNMGYQCPSCKSINTNIR